MTDISRLRTTALAQIDRMERLFKSALYGAVLMEGLLLAAFLFTANLKDPLHRLLFFGVSLVYMPLVLGLMALGAHINRCTLRVLARMDEE